MKTKVTHLLKFIYTNKIACPYQYWEGGYKPKYSKDANAVTCKWCKKKLSMG